ncbi:MAG: ATP-binding cassette domain-containing protein [Bifidobacteriaceae bacterium]|nr:ATP-binding cassette domain-containing protein [Bifidobacteriaceae bacterium]
MEKHAEPCIEFRNAAVQRGGRTIWSEGTFAIERGTVTAIVGTNGAGKTTMIDVELGLLPLCHGSVTVLGCPAGQSNSRIGYVPQNYMDDVDSNVTVSQSVLLGLTGTRFGFHRVTRQQKDAVASIIEFVGLGGKEHMRLNELSGGLRQRAAIAQALVSHPDLLLLDEPLANLDLASQSAIVELFAQLNREWGMTIQIVSHDLNMLLPILTGAVYLLDGHPHYSGMSTVLDSDLLTHLYGTKVEVVTTPQGDMFVTPNPDVEPAGHGDGTLDASEAATFFRQHYAYAHAHSSGTGAQTAGTAAHEAKED